MTHYSGVITHPVTIGRRDTIADGTSFGSWVEVSDCPGFVSFPDGTSFGSWVVVSDCPGFVSFPDGTSFGSWVVVSDCPGFVSFPDGTSFGSSVVVRNCPGFVSFPDGTSFGSWVEVSDCPGFTWSEGCTFKGRALPSREIAEERIRKIAATVAAEPDRLHMGDWHCGTSHCIAGWAVHQEGAEGYALERELGGEGVGTRDAGLLLLGLEAAGKFYLNNDAALEWLKSKLVEADG